MERLTGKTFNNRYEIISVLGEGGMGAVLKGFDSVLDREIAIKIMHTQFARQPNMRERFLQEARTAGRLNHPSIVKVYDFGQQDDLLYIVMEFIQGDNLRVILDGLKEKQKRVLLDEAVHTIAQLANAIDYAHRHGVLHRDIKPGNVMIVPEATGALPYRPVLTDLGLAKLLEGQPITREGVSMGTPAYMSPEQALGQKIDARSDVYSLGILLYEMCAGRTPFPARTLSEAIRYHTKEPPPPPRTIRADIPLAVEDVILRAISKAPSDRFDDAAQFADSLKKLSAESRQVQPQGSISLMTEYQQSLLTFRGKSVLKDFQPVKTPQGQDSIKIMDPQRRTTSHAITSKVITIGRGKKNDIALEDTKASREHVKIEFDDKDYYITDLKSTNGTYLENTRLLPGVPEIWAPEKPLRIGKSWLHLQVASRAEEPITDRYSTEVAADLPSAAQSITGKRVTATLETEKMTVDPGSRITQKVLLLNHGQLVDHFSLSVAGIPSDWVTILSDEIQLMPRERHELQFAVHPPRSPESRAGEYPIQIQISSQVAPTDISEIGALLTVTPYYQLDFVIRPQRQQGVSEANYTTILRNLCNTPLSFYLEGEDPEDICLFESTPAVIAVEPGHEKSGKLKVSLKRFIPAASTRTRTFTMTARVRETTEISKQSYAEWEQTPLLLGLSVSPQAVRGGSHAIFNLSLKNKGGVDLPIQLDGQDEAGKCELSFDPRSLVIPIGGEGRSRLKVTSRSPLSSSSTLAHKISVHARLVDSPGTEQKVNAEWIQTPPSFESSILAIQPKGEHEGVYSVRVKNTGDADLTLHLAGVDSEHACEYQFSQQSITLAPQQEAVSQLTVKPKQAIYGDSSRVHPFQVSIQPVQAPSLEQRAAASWEQLPSVKSGSLFLCWLLIAIGWAIALFAGVVAVDIFGGLTGWVVGGIATGVIGGFMTGLGLRSAERNIKFKHIFGLMVGFSAIWSMANLLIFILMEM